MVVKYLVPGLRTPFVKAGGPFAQYDTIQLSIPIVRRLAELAPPDFLIWGQVIPSPTVSNVGRELLLEAGLDPEIPAFSTILACSTSMMAAIQAAGLVGYGDMHLALVGGAETMSRAPIALKEEVAVKMASLLAANPQEAAAAFGGLAATDFDLPARGWANRISGRTMGDHTEDTVKHFEISRQDQDRIALQSHQNAVRAQDAGFFDDLVVPLEGIGRDTLPRRDTTADKLASLKTVFDPGPGGSITAGNSSPLTDGAAALWVADEQGLERLGRPVAARLVDWQISAMDWTVEGIIMAPARAIPRLLARHNLRFEDIDLWELHEAFAGQVLANVKAFSDPSYRRQKVNVTADLGEFPWERLNPNGGSLAIGHPFAATGARIISQAVKELALMGPGKRALVSICADGGQGTVLLIESV